MKIIIVGDNLTACAIAKSLIQEAHDITLIGNSALRLKHIEETLDIQTVFGDYTHVETYDIAECDQADIMITATEVPEIDLLASMIGMNTFDVTLMITVIQGSIYCHHQNIMGPKNRGTQQQIWISPAALISHNIIDLINHPDYHEVVSITDSQCLARVQINRNDKPNSKVWLQNLRSQNHPGRLITIIRDNEQIAHAKQLETHDHVLLACPKEDLNHIIATLRTPKSIQSIMIAGISAITQTLVDKISPNIHLKVIEKDITKATNFAEKNNHTTVLEGDINDAELLVSEKIDQTDAFFALSHDDEDNLVAALQAKRHQVETVTSLVYRPEISPIIEENDIFSIEPQKMIVEKVYAIIHSDTITKKYSLHKNTGEIICCRVPKHLDKKSIDTLQLNDQSLVLDWQRKQKSLHTQRTTIMHHQDQIAFYLDSQEAVAKLQEHLSTPKQSLFEYLGLSH